jgi:hypothetical protein
MFKILLVPVTEEEASEQQKMPMPPWAGLCEGAITRNISGPHDMESIRESIVAAKAVLSINGLEHMNPGLVDRLIHAEGERQGMPVLSCEKSFHRLVNAEVIP